MRRTLLNRRISRIISLSRRSLNQDSNSNKLIDQIQATHQATLTRRQLLGGAAGLGAGLAIQGCRTLRSNPSNSSKLDNTRNIAILGGGAAGLTAAYRLMQAGRSSTIYEGESSRIGGRMWTHRNFNKDSQFVERGAELVDTLNSNLIPLAQELGLEIELYEPGDRGLISEFFYYNGKKYTDEDLYKGLQPFLASVAIDLAAAFPGGVDSVTYKTKANPDLIKFDRMNLAEYFASKKNTTEAWVIAALSQSYLTEYGDDLFNQSALNFLGIADTDLSDGFTWYGLSDETRRIKGGNSQITERLRDRIQGNIPIKMGHTLIAIREVSQGIQMTFAEEGGSTREFVADQVICTLPFSTLRMVDGIDKLNLNPIKKRSITELGYGTNVKHMVGFTNRAWRKGIGGVPPTTGMLTTDLSMGMVWETSRLQAGNSGILTNFLGGTDGIKATPEGNLRRMLAGIDSFWPGLAKLHDGNTIMQHWPSMPLARGSYTSPRAGQYTTFFGCEGETELKGRLIFAGEHTSPDWWGFMNGAIQSGERAAKEVLGEKFSGVPAGIRKWKKLPA